MSHKPTPLTEELQDYIHRRMSGRDPLLQELIEETGRLGSVRSMQIAPEQGAFMTLVCQMVGVRQAIEIGSFTGYSGLCLARGLLPGGRLLACDVSEEWTRVARRYWARAGVADRIDLVLGPALDTLRALPRQERFDLAFLDGDKGNYVHYYEELVPRLRPGGVLLVDNVLWSGLVLDGAVQDADTRAIRALNDRVAMDDRVEAVILPIADGLTVCRKRDAPSGEPRYSSCSSE